MLGLIIRGTAGFFCSGSFSSAEAALTGIKELPVDVMLVDIELPDMSGIEALGRLKQLKPGADCLILSIRQDDVWNPGR